MSWDAAPTGRRGRQQSDSDAAIQSCLSMKVLCGMVVIDRAIGPRDNDDPAENRSASLTVESRLRLVGLDWTVPDFSTLSRRQKSLAVDTPYRGSKGPLDLLIDNEASTAIGPRTMPNGLKVEGEGEWHARKPAVRNGFAIVARTNGAPRLTWPKIHLGIDEETLEIRAVESSPAIATGPKEPVDGSHIGDAPVLPDPRAQIPEDELIGSVTADGAYDTRKCHDVIADRGAHAVIPPRKNAKPWKTVTAGAMARKRIPPPEPRRDHDALHETAGPAAHGAGLRPPGRRTPGPHSCPERLHCARHTYHTSRGMSLAGKGDPRPSADLCNRVLSGS